MRIICGTTVVLRTLTNPEAIPEPMDKRTLCRICRFSPVCHEGRYMSGEGSRPRVAESFTSSQPSRPSELEKPCVLHSSSYCLHLRLQSWHLPSQRSVYCIQGHDSVLKVSGQGEEPGVSYATYTATRVYNTLVPTSPWLVEATTLVVWTVTESPQATPAP